MNNIVGIYKITNLLDNKSYIGQSKSIYKRWNAHKKMMGHDNYLYKAFEKYGIENFSFEILIDLGAEDDWTKQLLNFYETYFVFYYGSMYFDNGYNIKFPGSNGSPSKETKLKISKASKGIKITSQETKNKQSEANKNKIKIINLDTKEIFNSLSKASKKYSISTSNISKCCKGKQVSTLGQHWAYYDDYITDRIKLKKLEYKNIKVINTITGEIFDSVTEASKKYNIATTNISKCCKGSRHSAGNYKWEYYIL